MEIDLRVLMIITHYNPLRGFQNFFILWLVHSVTNAYVCCSQLKPNDPIHLFRSPTSPITIRVSRTKFFPRKHASRKNVSFIFYFLQKVSIFSLFASVLSMMTYLVHHSFLLIHTFHIIPHMRRNTSLIKWKNTMKSGFSFCFIIWQMVKMS